MLALPAWACSTIRSGRASWVSAHTLSARTTRRPVNAMVPSVTVSPGRRGGGRILRSSCFGLRRTGRTILLRQRRSASPGRRRRNAARPAAKRPGCAVWCRHQRVRRRLWRWRRPGTHGFTGRPTRPGAAASRRTSSREDRQHQREARQRDEEQQRWDQPAAQPPDRGLVGGKAGVGRAG